MVSKGWTGRKSQRTLPNGEAVAKQQRNFQGVDPEIVVMVFVLQTRTQLNEAKARLQAQVIGQGIPR
jgi:hypothetical protein